MQKLRGGNTKGRWHIGRTGSECHCVVREGFLEEGAGVQGGAGRGRAESVLSRWDHRRALLGQGRSPGEGPAGRAEPRGLGIQGGAPENSPPGSESGRVPSVLGPQSPTDRAA